MKMNGFWVYTHTTPDGMVYVGQSGAKYTSHRWSPNYYKQMSIEQYIKLWGWENIKHTIIKDGLSYDEAKSIENEMILLLVSLILNVVFFDSNLVNGVKSFINPK